MTVNRQVAELESQINLSKHEQELAGLRYGHVAKLINIKFGASYQGETRDLIAISPHIWHNDYSKIYSCNDTHCVSI
jgi:hypothetical protein